MTKVEELTRVLARLSAGADIDLIKSEHRFLFESTTPMDAALAGQNLLLSGMFLGDFCKLCGKYLSFFGDPTKQFKNQLAHSHPIRSLLSIHYDFDSILAGFEQVNAAISKLASSGLAGAELGTLSRLLDHFGPVWNHMEFEQNTISPELEQAGFPRLTQLIRYQHLDLDQSYAGLIWLTRHVAELDFAQFKGRLNAVIDCFVSMSRMHLIVEEVVLYPIASETITNMSIWDKFKPAPQSVRQSA
jgi:DUF438 domain-containing protein